MSNIYYNPEEYDLKKIYEANAADSYEFDILAIWQRNSDKRILMGADSGCSCPSPFEDFYLKDLEPATHEAINEWFDNPDYSPRRNRLGADERQKALATLEKGGNMNAKDLGIEIKQKEEELHKLKTRKEALEKQTPEMGVAIKLHALLCHYDHTEGCSWHYEMHDKVDDWSGNRHKEFLKKGTAIVEAVGVTPAEAFLDALEKTQR